VEVARNRQADIWLIINRCFQVGSVSELKILEEQRADLIVQEFIRGQGLPLTCLSMTLAAAAA